MQHEYSMHVTFWDWCCLNGIDKYVYAIEHGELRNPIIGKKLKRKGVKKGIADYLLLKPNSSKSSLWIEFKHGKNKQTPTQIEFEHIAEECGHSYICCYTVEDAIKNITDYLSG